MSAADAHGGVLGSATPTTVTVHATPTEDATVTALSKEKLVQEVQQLKDQNEPDFFGWLRANASLLLSTLVVVIGGLIGLWRWLGDRRDAQEKVLKDQQSEREKRAEERFQAAVTGLGDDKEGARIGAAILLRTFLRPGYEQFYTQTFDLAVANLRLPRTPHPTEDPDGLSYPPENPTVAQSLTTLSQALIVVYKESFPLARDTFLAHGIFKEEDTRYGLAFLDASHIQLDHAYLHTTDLKQAWLPHAFLRKANLTRANLTRANLSEADLSEASLFASNLRAASLLGANLSRAGLSGANLSDAKLRKTDLARADLRKTNLSGADLSEAKLTGADLHQAKLTHANFSGADLSEAKLIDADLRNTTLSKTNLSKATLTGAKFISDVDLIPKAKLRAAKASKENRLLADFTRGILRLTNLSEVNFSEADLSKATLTGVTLTRAQFNRANLSKASLRGANLSGADLSEAKFLGADLIDADLSKADLSDADLSDADLSDANLINANLKGACLKGADLSGTMLKEADLSGADLRGTNLHNVKGLTKEQLAACKAKGAIIDEDATTSASQSTIAPSPPAQSNDAQASLALSTGGSVPTPDTDGSSTPPSSPADPQP